MPSVEKLRDSLKRLQKVTLPGLNEQKEAQQFEESVFKGVNIEPLTSLVLQTYRESSNVTILEPLANGLAYHLVVTKQIHRLARLLHRPKFSTYLLSGLSKACKSGLDIGCAIESIVRCYGREWSLVNSRVKQLLYDYVEGQHQRLSDLSLMLLEKPLWRTLFLDFLGEFWHTKDADYSPALGALAKLLFHRKRSIRHKSADIVDVAVARKSNFKTIVPLLERALYSRDNRVRSTAALALAHWKEELLQKLLVARDASTKVGAIKAFSLLADKNYPKDLYEKVALSLTDGSKEVRRAAASCLGHFKVTELSQSTVHALFTALRKNSCRYAILQYLDDLIGLEPSFAQWLSKELEGYKDSNNPALHNLRHQVKRKIEGSIVAQCSLCSAIGRRRYERYPERFPKCIDMFEPKLDLSNSPVTLLTKCKDCLNWYEFRHEVEVTTLGDWHDYTLTRLTPTKALNLLRGSQKAEFECAYVGIIRNHQELLDGLSENLRKEAAWSLTHHYCQAADWSSLGQLLLHCDRAVQCEALSTLKNLLSTLKDTEPIIHYLEKLFELGSKKVRSLSANILCRFYLHRKDFKAIASLMDDGDEMTCVAALSGLCSEKLNRKNLMGLLPQLTRCLCDHRDKVVSRTRLFLKQCFEKKLVDYSYLDTVHELLRNNRATTRAEAAAILGDWRTFDKSLPVRIDLLTQLFDDRETQASAFYAVRVCVNTGSSIESLSGPMARALSDESCRGMNDGLWAIQTALEKKQDVSPLICALGVQAGYLKHRQRAVCLLRKAAENGINIDCASNGLKKALRDDSTFTRQEAKAALCKCKIEA